MPIGPIASPATYAGQARAAAISQPAPSVQSVKDAAAPIIGAIVEARGQTVGVLTHKTRAEEGGLEGAGMYTGSGGGTIA
ncbi:MAG: hypothetical protein JNK11_13985 [Alphaproteobacteria bacterium]|nr:hypothetical protein [Alphaproteobacteria bacterium]